jgi:hypothetical protein
MIVLGFIVGLVENQIRSGLRQSLDRMRSATPDRKSEGSGAAGAVEQQAAILADLAELNRSLAELAKAITGLSPSIQLFIISTIFFALAAALATVDVIAK